MKRACKPRGIDEPDPRAYSTGPGSFIMMRIVLHFESRDLKGAPRARTQTSLAIVYLAAAIVALGTLVCQFWGPYTYRFMLLMRDPMPRIVVTACGGVVAIGVLVSFFRLMFARREPSCVHPAGERNIEVTLAALSSCARGCCRTRQPRDGRACRGPRPRPRRFARPI